MVVVYGRDGRAIQHNSAAEAALGGELLDGVRERAIPLVWEDGTPIPADERPFARALKTKAPVRGTIVGYGGTTRRWAFIDAVPVLDENGEVEVVVTSSIDITRLKAAEEKQRESEQLFSGAFEASGVAMAMTDMNGVIIRINPAYSALLGYTSSEVVGMGSQDLVAPDDLEAAMPRFMRLASGSEGPSVTVALRARHRDGHAIWTRVTGAVLQRYGLHMKWNHNLSARFLNHILPDEDRVSGKSHLPLP